MVRTRSAGALASVMLTLCAGSVAANMPAAHAAPPTALTVTGPEVTGAAAPAVQAADTLVATRPEPLLSTGDDTFVRQTPRSAGGTQYVPYERTYRGLPVIGGDFVVAVTPAGRSSVAAVAQQQPIRGLVTTPRLTGPAARRTALAQLTAGATVERTRLVVHTRGATPRLAWEVTVSGRDAQGASRLAVAVDADTGAVLEQRQQIMHDTGNGYFNGPGPLTVPAFHYSYVDFTQLVHERWQLGDQTRAPLNCNATRTDPPTVPVWGNGDPTTVETGCVDAVFAAEKEVGMLSQWLGRNGMDGAGHGFVMVVGLNDNNAQYDSGPFHEVVEIGTDFDGKWLSTLDVVGHENGHGVDNHTPGGFSGNGTSEFIADAFGAATEWYANESAPYDTPDYVIGDRTRLFNRDMYAAACYTSATPTMEVHGAAAPGDHWFYLLSEGTAPTDGQPSSPTCNGSTMTGIGIVGAMRVLYNAMLMKTSNSSYLTYRTATLQAAKNLYPSDCTVFNSVKAAWDAVSVPAQTADPTCVTRVHVPDVAGDTRTTATTALTGAGLRVGTVTSTVDSSCNNINKILSSTPTAGTYVDAGTTVNLTIGTHPKPPADCP